MDDSSALKSQGSKRVLSLAEVQVFGGTDNLAPRGRQPKVAPSLTVWPSWPSTVIPNGKYFESKSVTHTSISDDPWWEVDLQSSQAVDRVVIWNRTDSDLEGRLADFRIALLNDQRQPVSGAESSGVSQTEQRIRDGSAQTSLPFGSALADTSQEGFDPQHVLQLEKDKADTKGWAIGSQTGKPHTLTLLANAPVEMAAGATLSLTIEQQSKLEKHTLGCFRISVSDDGRVKEFAGTPANVVAILATDAVARTEDQRKTVLDYYLSQVAPELQPTRVQLAAAKKRLAELKPNTLPILRELAADKQRKTNLQHRGNYLDLGPEVSAGIPAAFQSLPPDAPMNRLTMAKWLVDGNNPLTARVVANRFWEQIFGIGIVRTSEEFGSQGELPSHPELLDWLAVELVESGWNVKQFLKLLVTSAAYRQSSKVTPELYERDPENRLLARGPRFRLSAEMVRDQALFVSGLLSTKMYGPSVKPPQPALGLSAAFGSTIDWKTSDGEDRFRRGLYTEWRRSNPYPSMITFDAPNREVCTIRRARTNTPLQALVTLNDPVYIESAQALRAAWPPPERLRSTKPERDSGFVWPGPPTITNWTGW